MLEGLSAAVGDEDVAISVLTLLELAHGAARPDTSTRRAMRLQYIQDLMTAVPVHPVTVAIALRAGQIDGENQAQGIRLSLADLFDWRDSDRIGLSRGHVESPALSVGAWLNCPIAIGLRGFTRRQCPWNAAIGR